MRELPRAMLIDMDDTILSAHGHPEIAWNIVATEFAGELGQFSPRQAADAIADTARQFWAVAAAEGAAQPPPRAGGGAPAGPAPPGRGGGRPRPPPRRPPLRVPI